MHVGDEGRQDSSEWSGLERCLSLFTKKETLSVEESWYVPAVTHVSTVSTIAVCTRFPHIYYRIDNLLGVVCSSVECANI